MATGVTRVTWHTRGVFLVTDFFFSTPTLDTDRYGRIRDPTVGILYPTVDSDVSWRDNNRQK